MKIIVAPAKTMKPKLNAVKPTELLFESKTDKLHQYLSKFSIEELHDLMKISFKLSSQVYDYYHDDNPLMTPALYCYQGTVFKQLSLNSYQKDDFDYLDEHLAILSAYYGVLKYHTGIYPYRLDMTMKLDFDLYSFWHDPVKEYFSNDDYIISLASKEFNKMVEHPNIINIDFVERKSDRLVRNSMRVKQARGKMLEAMVKQKITTFEQLKALIVADYIYQEELSTKNNLVFLRDSLKVYQKL